MVLALGLPGLVLLLSIVDGDWDAALGALVMMSVFGALGYVAHRIIGDTTSGSLMLRRPGETTQEGKRPARHNPLPKRRARVRHRARPPAWTLQA